MNLKNMFPTETMRMALDTLRTHKFRSFLTTLGIVIGVMTVIAIASILTGLRSNLIQMIEDYGTSNIYAFHLSTGFGPPNVKEERTRKPLRIEDAEAIRERAGSVEEVSACLFMDWHFNKTINYNGLTYKSGNLQGVSASYAKATNQVLQEGRFFTEMEDHHRRDCMVIGETVAEALFPHQTRIVGTVVMMGGRPFEIVGVLEKKKTSFLGENDDDSAVFIPFRTAKKLSPSSEWILLIIRARTGELAAAMTQVEDILRRQRNVKFSDPNDFDLSTADKIISQFDSITAVLGLVMIAMSGVGLLVGGIGVMNIMLVSVRERTQEIGVRMAIGARRRDIVLQFLFEAMTLTSLGGILGIVLAVIASRVVAWLVPALPTSVPMWAVVTGIVVSIAIGLIFGVWPAKKAAGLDPIEALRYE